MKSDPFALTLLFDYYGDLLTEKQKICFDLYYNQDLTLAEIAEEAGISRQGVHDSIARAEAALRTMEDKIGCVRRDMRLRQVMEEISALARELAGQEDEAASRLGQRIEALAGQMKE